MAFGWILLPQLSTGVIHDSTDGVASNPFSRKLCKACGGDCVVSSFLQNSGFAHKLPRNCGGSCRRLLIFKSKENETRAKSCLKFFFFIIFGQRLNSSLELSQWFFYKGFPLFLLPMWMPKSTSSFFNKSPYIFVFIFFEIFIYNKVS